MRFLLTILLIFFITGCTKRISVKSLQTPHIQTKDIKYIHVENFLEDNINQTEYIEEELSKKRFENNKLFFLRKNSQNIDAIITGEVLESSVFYNLFYRESQDDYYCKKYDYKNKKCLLYAKSKYPCENREYLVKTNLKVLDSNKNIIFTKNYSKSKNNEVCFENRSYRHFYKNREKNRINSELAKDIAKDILKDLAPYYRFEDVEIIDELQENKSLYTEQIRNEFKNIIQLIEESYYELAKQKLINLDKKLNGKSYEISYNLALIYEYQEKLHTAHSLYKDSLENCNFCEKKELIESSFIRVNNNINNKKILDLR